MDCKGTVIDINNFFGYFILNDGTEINTRVHFSILLSQNPTLGLPVVGSSVVIKNAHKHRSGSTFIVCNTSYLEGSYDVQRNSDEFINFVSTNKLGAADLIKADETMKMLNNFADISNEIKCNLTLLILDKILLLSEGERDQCQCLSKRISQFNLISVNSCHSVDLKSDKYLNFPYWSFGIHSKKNRNTLLFGYLKIQPTYGIFLLTDSFYNLPCIVVNKTNKGIISLVNSYVLIKNYKICSEIFSDDVPNLEYLTAEFDDIIIVKSADNVPNLFVQPNIPVHHYIDSICFDLIRKSTICIGNSNKPECWLQVSIFDTNKIKSGRSAFLILPCKYIPTTISLIENRRYKLYFNVPLQEATNIELSRLEACKIYELTDNDAYFQALKDEIHIYDKILAVEECLNYILTNSGVVSFQGVLKQKKFANNLSSRTRKKSILYGFGTPGSKVHQLVFTCKENDKDMYLDCYLNNWENTLMPLGLIPQMRVTIRNVLPQSRKYLKSTPLTSLEIMSYEPIIDFQTVNLMYVFDEFGSSKVLVKDVGFLKYILDLQESQFQVWKRGFLELEHYSFNIFEDKEVYNVANDEGILKNILTTYLFKFNKCAMICLDLKCRKLDSTSNKNCNRPLWFYLNARKN